MIREQFFKELKNINHIDYHSENPVSNIVFCNQDVFFKNGFSNEVLNVIKEIKNKDNSIDEDVVNFLNGILISEPYGRHKFVKELSKNIKGKYVNVSSVVNNFLVNNFEKNNKELYSKLANFEYSDDSSSYITFTSKDALQIQQIVKLTDACVKDDPMNFFTQIASDFATIYFLSVNKNQINFLNSINYNDLDLAYARLYLHQNKDSSDFVFGVDNIFINSKSNKLITNLIHQFENITDYFGIGVIDHAITKDYLNNKSKNLDIKLFEENFYKVGKTPLIDRFIPPVIKKDNAYYFIS
ncbi:MAG: hypothetical protein U9R00_00890 [Patescibacteria group bacterium]|nr:hypothetical protein [Patescibacteria group bacterium]